MLPRVTDEPETWHHGLMALWWAQSEAEPDEFAYYRGAIERFGQPALDLGAGTGRILLPLLATGLDVEGVDVSSDMLDQARQAGISQGLSPVLHAQAFHALDLPRRFRTIYSVDSFGIGASRAQDLEALRRTFRHLEPGGALVFSHDQPWAGVDELDWARWLPGRRTDLPRDWPAEPEKRMTAGGDALELLVRSVWFDPLQQCRTIEMKARLLREGSVIREDRRSIRLNHYFAQELLQMLEAAGFSDVAVEGRYNGAPATPDDETLVFVARHEAPA